MHQNHQPRWGCPGPIWPWSLPVYQPPLSFLVSPWSHHPQSSGIDLLDFPDKWVLDFQSVDDFVLILQGGDVGTQYRSGIYYYNEAQAKLAQESKEAKQLGLTDNTVVTEILPAKRFYRAEEYHQQYLEKGGGRSAKQSAEKGCNDPIRCYG